MIDEAIHQLDDPCRQWCPSLTAKGTILCFFSHKRSARSATMADNKGKGIQYEDDDDDETILLPDQADENLINEYRLSLTGKILNPKKQNVERLIVAMPQQWGLSEKITACDLGNGRFLFNFDNEEDLMSVLNKAPFHHNYCMFVLERWEPVIDENYPSMIPFWIQLQGIPLHLCTELNLRTIGDKLGSVDLIDATEGKI